MSGQADTYIDVLRVRGAMNNDVALRLAVSNRIGGGDFNPPGMAPSSVLVVRKMEDPLPGSIDSKGGAGRLPAEWERAVRGRLEDFRRSAVQPERGLIPGGAEAVIFRDEAELLACLAIAISRGEAWRQWWWRLFLRTSSSFSGRSLSIARIFAEKATFLPAALDFLDKWGKLEDVLDAFNADDARRLLIVMLDVFDVKEVACFLSASDSGLSPAGEGEGIGGMEDHGFIKEKGEPGDRAAIRAFHSALTPPWREYLQSGALPARMNKEKRCLAGLGLMLFRMPWVAGSGDFQSALIKWLRSCDDLPCREESHLVADTAVQEKGKKGIEFFTASGGDADAAMPPPVHIRKGKKPEKYAAKTGEVGLEGSGSGGERVSSGTLKRDRPGGDGEKGNGKDYEDRAGSGSGKREGKLKGKRRGQRSGYEEPFPAEDNSVAEERDSSIVNGDFVPTRLGGILYLVNVMVGLDLPQCFEEECRLASLVGPWGTLELLGRALMGDKLPDYEDDPLWGSLAELDGRKPGEPPGIGFEGPKEYSLPESWLDEAEGAAHIMEPPIDGPDPLKMEGLHSGLTRWTALVLPYVRWRLQLALGTGVETVPELFVCPGRLYITSTHIDFVTDINNISIEARKSGLDRNPGWLAAFGRVVSFHFE